MLINLSNHPSENWNEKQKKMARDKYNTIADIPFPQVPPEATQDEVAILAEAYFVHIRKLAANEPTTIHIMGEMTLTYMLINRLKEVGIPCLASTTQRIVKEVGNKKTVTFNFIRFFAS